MGLQKGQYPKNFGEPHSNGTLINEVTAPIFYLIAIFIGFALGSLWLISIITILGAILLIYGYKNNPNWR